MSRIEIHMEGGGPDSKQRGVLQEGLDILFDPLRQQAQDHGLGWKTALHGSRDQAYRSFEAAWRNPGDGIHVLLVDSEGPVNGPPRHHLHLRDHWNLGFAPESRIHLMAQVMETWLVADPDALRAFYGRGLIEGRLPKHANPEAVSKGDIAKALKRATEGSSKGPYRKIEHASAILRRLNRDLVRRKCPHFDRFFVEMIALIESAGCAIPQPKRRGSGWTVREPAPDFFGESVWPDDSSIPPPLRAAWRVRQPDPDRPSIGRGQPHRLARTIVRT